MLFYDFEVFKYDWLVVIIDATKKEYKVIINNADELETIYDENKNDIWVGYNNLRYDQYIFQGILCGFNPKDINDYMIVYGNQGYKFSNMFRNYPMNNYDVMLNGDKGLKSLEGFMGNDIKESSIPFDIDRKLTDEEIEETIKYCKHDVEQTIEVFIKRIDEFNTMMYFIKYFKLPLNAISKTKAQLAADILGGNYKGRTFDDEFDFPILDCLDLKKYRFVADWYMKDENHNYSKKQKDIMIAGVPHNFQWGGGHGAIPKYHAKGEFLIIDVTAYYPSLQEKYKFGYRVMDNPQNFEFIHHSNIEFKRKGDKKARLPFKIMDNAISGQMKQYNSKLFDPMSNNSICVNGQLLLLDLIEHLEPYCQLIQNNTDGIIIKLRDYEKDFDIIDDIVYEWEQRTGMKMDFDTFFGEIFQKDVNNYLIIDRETGKYKAKGSYLKNLSDLDYDLPILNKALKNYMIDGIPIETTIYKCDDFKEYQLMAKLSDNYMSLWHGGTFRTEKIDRKNVKRYNFDGESMKEKCIRIFASIDERDGMFFKQSKRTGNMEKIANCPLHAFSYNGNINDLKVPEKLDKQWYIDMANKRLKDFGGDI